MLVEGCLGQCYRDLPQPEIVLSPEDTELSYFLWMPGFKYEPTLQKKLSTLRYASSDGETIIFDDVIDEVIERDELEKRFSELARGGSLHIGDAGQLARELGSTPSTGDMLEFAATYGSSLSLDQFKQLCAVSMYPDETPEFLASILHQFAQENGKITLKRLEHIVRNYGEAFTKAEMDAVAELFFSGSDSIDCESFAAKLSAKG